MSSGSDWNIGDWCRHTRHTTPCRIIDRQSIWSETVFRVWLPTKDAIIRARVSDLAPLASLEPTENEILHTAAAAKLLDALEDNLLLAPIQSSVVPLPHQLHALNKAMSGERIRYLLADEVGLGKTIEAGLILRKLKLRGMVRRVLVVAPKSLVRQWQAEMHLHFGESFRLIEPAEIAALRSFVSSAVPGDRSGTGERDDNLWLMHDQVIRSIDSVKPLEGRRGWSLERLATYNRERFEDHSVAAEPWFDELFVKGITDPESVDQQCDAVVTQIREKVAESRQGSDLIAEETSEGQRFSAEEARQWRDHPAQLWLERTITTGLPIRGGEAVQDGDHWRIRWLDGSESARACFDARTAEARPELDWDQSLAAATGQGEQHIRELMALHRTRLQEARERARYAFEARDQAIGRIGLPAVRAYRRRRLEQDHKERMATLDAAETSLPDLNAIMMLRVGPGFAAESGAAGGA